MFLEIHSGRAEQASERAVRTRLGERCVTTFKIGDQEFRYKGERLSVGDDDIVSVSGFKLFGSIFTVLSIFEQKNNALNNGTPFLDIAGIMLFLCIGFILYRGSYITIARTNDDLEFILLAVLFWFLSAIFVVKFALSQISKIMLSKYI